VSKNVFLTELWVHLFTLDFILGEKNFVLEEIPKTIPFAISWVKFFKPDPSIFLKFHCGIKNDALSEDCGKHLTFLLVFLNPEIASNLQPNHPNLNPV